MVFQMLIRTANAAFFSIGYGMVGTINPLKAYPGTSFIYYYTTYVATVFHLHVRLVTPAMLPWKYVEQTPAHQIINGDEHWPPESETTGLHCEGEPSPFPHRISCRLIWQHSRQDHWRPCLKQQQLEDHICREARISEAEFQHVDPAPRASYYTQVYFVEITTTLYVMDIFQGN